MNENHVYDMIIVGGGPGGYTSALYAARAGFDTIVLEKLSAGGQMSLTWQIDNYPGFENGIDGFSLAEKMQKQAEKFGAKSEYAEVFNMDRGVFRLPGQGRSLHPFPGPRRGAGNPRGAAPQPAQRHRTSARHDRHRGTRPVLSRLGRRALGIYGGRHRRRLPGVVSVFSIPRNGARELPDDPGNAEAR